MDEEFEPVIDMVKVLREPYGIECTDSKIVEIVIRALMAHGFVLHRPDKVVK